jgi:hypothetical protein
MRGQFHILGPRHPYPGLRLRRIENDGTWSPAFGDSGQALCQPPCNPANWSFRSDGESGVLIAWPELRGGSTHLYATWYRSDGARGPGWRADGDAIATLPVAVEMQTIVANLSGSAILGWRDPRNGQGDLFAARFSAGAPPPAASGPGADDPAGVRKRATLAGAGSESASDRGTGVSDRLELSFAGVRPNPSARELNFEFVLSRSGDANLRMVDVAGRVMVSRLLTGLAAGRHRVALTPGSPLSPGVYVAELSAEGRRIQRKAVVAR